MCVQYLLHGHCVWVQCIQQLTGHSTVGSLHQEQHNRVVEAGNKQQQAATDGLCQHMLTSSTLLIRIPRVELIQAKISLLGTKYASCVAIAS